jgi:hypothetical protein
VGLLSLGLGLNRRATAGQGLLVVLAGENAHLIQGTESGVEPITVRALRPPFLFLPVVLT